MYCAAKRDEEGVTKRPLGVYYPLHPLQLSHGATPVISAATCSVHAWGRQSVWQWRSGICPQKFSSQSVYCFKRQSLSFIMHHVQYWTLSARIKVK